MHCLTGFLWAISLRVSLVPSPVPSSTLATTSDFTKSLLVLVRKRMRRSISIARATGGITGTRGRKAWALLVSSLRDMRMEASRSLMIRCNVVVATGEVCCLLDHLHGLSD